MKFKLFSAALLLVCFLFLGVLAGVIPVTGPADTAAEEPAAVVSAAVTQPPAAPTASVRPAAVLPTARLAGTAAPEPSAGPFMGPTDSPAPVSPSATPAPSAGTDAPAPTAESAPSPEPVSVSEQDLQTVAAAALTAQAELDFHPWEPEARVVSTTITWSDPVQNDTDFAVDGKALLAGPLDIALPAAGRQVLIIHTHGTEAFTPDGDDQYEATSDYRTTDTDHTIIQVGLALGKALESYGLNVLVDTELYDWPSYNGSYGRSEEAIKRHLEEDPGIAMVIDLHRDALGDDQLMYRPVSDQVAQDAAQIMFVVGTDANLEHPNWRQNLALAMSLQGLVEEQYPHLMRPTLVCPYRYNQQLTAGSLLLEIGAAGNTLDEALTAAELFAQAVGPALAERVGA